MCLPESLPKGWDHSLRCENWVSTFQTENLDGYALAYVPELLSLSSLATGFAKLPYNSCRITLW